MSAIGYIGGQLHIDGVPASALADRFGTPAYAYSARAIEANAGRVVRAFAALNPRVCYAVKACGNLAILKLIHAQGLGMDVVSGGELERAFLAGVPMRDITFAGVGKAEWEIRAALSGAASPLLASGDLPVPVERVRSRGAVGMFNVESEGELARIDAIAREVGVRARCCLRVNPNVDAHTHKYTTTGTHDNKFGVPIERARAIVLAARGLRGVEVVGLHAHLGSPIASPEPYVQAIRALLEVMDSLAGGGVALSHLNIGGGFGVDYEGPIDPLVVGPLAVGDGGVAPIERFGREIVPLLADRVSAGLRVGLEPGRVVVANAGVLLARVQYVKATPTKRFIVCDAGMHTLVRPALYGSCHFVWPARTSTPPTTMKVARSAPGLTRCDVVGPVCESSDFLAQDRELPEVEPGDVLGVFCAGAYGMSMSSTYNDHPRPCEVLVRDGEARAIRTRGDIAGLSRDEW